MNRSTGILITSGGDHPPLKWAMATADHIVHIGPNASPENQLAARELETAIARVLLPHHNKVQTGEYEYLGLKGDAAISFHPDPSAHIDAAVEEVVSCARGTVFEKLFDCDQGRDEIRATIGNHFATSMWNAHSHFVDKNSGGKNAKAFIALRDKALEGAS